MPNVFDKDLATVVFIPKNNFAATTDPGVGNDSSQAQGYSAGSAWVNTTNGRVWFCQSAAVGAAQWAIAVVPGVGADPSSMLTQFGGSTGTFREEGNLDRQISAAGVSPAATGSDYVIAITNIPALSFNATGVGCCLTAQGSFASNGNTKRIKIIAGAAAPAIGSIVSGGSTIADTAAVTTNGGGWSLQAQIFKTGALGSNTQESFHQQAQVGGAVAALLAPSALTLTESAIIPIVVTANCTTAASDVVWNFLENNVMN